MDYLASALAIGLGATAVMDVWVIARTRLLRVPAMSYGLLGRWLAHLPRSRFRRDAVAASPPVRGERAIGWTAHYAIGITFAAILPAVWGMEWVRHPTLWPALIVGIGSIAAPLLLMPGAVRFQSFVTHAIFGIGLYAAGRVTSLLSQAGAA